MDDQKQRFTDTTTALERTRVPFLEKILGHTFPVLDHGFIRVIDYMGDDQAIEQAARISYGTGTRKKNETQGLINYLMSHNHSTPFEMCEIKLHVKLPIFVARQWIRHRTANVNEYSARYSILKEEFYLPPLDQIRTQSTTNKQGRGEELDSDAAVDIRRGLNAHMNDSFDLYDYLLEHYDLSRELARTILPTSTYTEWYWKIDLHNLLHFLLLRADEHAQYEIRAYAEIIEWIVQRWVPLTWDAFRIYKKDAIAFSAHEALLIHSAIVVRAHELATKPTWADQLTEREWKAFQAKIARIY